MAWYAYEDMLRMVWLRSAPHTVLLPSVSRTLVWLIVAQHFRSSTCGDLIVVEFIQCIGTGTKSIKYMKVNRIQRSSMTVIENRSRTLKTNEAHTRFMKLFEIISSIFTNMVHSGIPRNTHAIPRNRTNNKKYKGITRNIKTYKAHMFTSEGEREPLGQKQDPGLSRRYLQTISKDCCRGIFIAFWHGF